MKKRLLSTMLALCLVLTMLPLNALATGELTPTETKTEVESLEEDHTTLENPTLITPTEITADDPIKSPDVDNAGELRVPLEVASGIQPKDLSSDGVLEKSTPRWSVGDTSGSCGADGDNVTWSINSSLDILTISGTGKMDDFRSNWVAPWFQIYNHDYVYYATKIKEVIIQDGVTYIGDCAFKGLENLLRITISDSVSHIGREAFADCDSLISVDIPNSVTRIKPYAFSNCKSLTNAEISESITFIDSGVFFGCTNLSSIVIPKNVTLIAYDAFGECNGLTEIYYSGSESDWSAINIQDKNDALKNAKIYYNSTGSSGSSSSGGVANRISKKRIGFYSSIGDRIYGMDIDWGWDLFLQGSSYNYDSRLAKIGLALSGATEHDPNYVAEMFQNGGSRLDDSNTKLNGLGFDNGLVIPKNYNRKWTDIKIGCPAVTFAHATVISSDGKKEHIIAIAIRGTTDGADIATDIASVFVGFDSSANNTYNLLDEYIKYCSNKKGEITKDNVKFFITGHSLGGAVANLLAERLNREYGSENIFAYTFATPRSTYNTSNTTNGNIHNILHAEDQVPVKLSNRTSRYGHDDWFSRFEYGNNLYQNFQTITNAGDLQVAMADKSISISSFIKRFLYGHATETYMAYLLARGNSTNRPASMIAFLVCCPVDVEVYVDDGTAEGQLVGRITDNVVDESVSSSLYAYTKGDEKYVCLPYEGDYTIKLTATDAGSMDYIVRTINLDTKETIEEKNYRNVALTKGKQMTSAVSVWDKDDNTTDVENKIDTPEVPLYVMDENGNEVFEILPDGNGTEVYISRTVTFNANGGTVSPVTMITGANGKLSSLPIPSRSGYRFKGWYTTANGGTQITADTIFISDTTIYAQWSKSNSSGNGGLSASETNHDSSLSNNNKPGIIPDNSSHDTKKSPNTGDSSSTIWLFVAGISLIVCIHYILKRRKRNANYSSVERR